MDDQNYSGGKGFADEKARYVRSVLRTTAADFAVLSYPVLL